MGRGGGVKGKGWGLKYGGRSEGRYRRGGFCNGQRCLSKKEAEMRI